MTWSIEQRAERVEALVFDVDGVLTDGSVFYGPGGEWKRFNIHDGHGFKLAARAGLKLALLTGRESEAVERRAHELGVDVLEQGVKNKGSRAPAVFEKLGVTADQVCYAGDDVIDMPVMRMVGLSVAPANAVDDVKACADWVTVRRGGDGAARELIDYILRAKGLREKVMKRYFEETP
jgi:3-deoxy-D-manno-octulosonate 8-phosphate phosphatase (KDO 8-P phosphatase)